MNHNEWDWPLVDVVDAHYVGQYTIWVRFANDVEGEVDLSDLLGRGVFAAFKDIEVFKRFRVEDGTIVWTEQIDIAPESLYRRVLDRVASTPPI